MLLMYTKLNSREIIKKVNHYALLRSDDSIKNYFLMAGIFLDGSSVFNKLNEAMKRFSDFYIKDKNKFIHDHRLGDIFYNGKNINNLKGYEWFKHCLSFEFKLSNQAIFNILNDYDLFGSNGEKIYIERRIDLFIKCLILEYDQSKSFDENLKNYIDGGM